MTTTTLVHQAVLYEQRTVIRREAMKDAAVVPWLVRTLTEIRDYLAKREIEPLSPPFARIRTVIGQKVVDAGFAVRETVPDNAYVRSSRLPQCKAAISLHHGEYREIGQTYAAVQDWLGLKGYAAVGTPWEFYLIGPTDYTDPDLWRTEVVVPYRIP